MLTRPGSIATLGVIFGDLSTSPIYCLSTIFPSNEPVPHAEDVIGAVSSILLALTLIALIKYCVIALQFGSGVGEGGPFAGQPIIISTRLSYIFQF